MPISDRIESTLERWRAKWGELLKGWLSNAIGFGVNVFMDVLAKSFATKLQPLIKTLEDTGQVPPELKPLLEEMKNPTGEAAAIMGSGMANRFVGGATGIILDALMLPTAYAIQSKLPFKKLSAQDYMALALRFPKDLALYSNHMRQLGLGDVEQSLLKELMTVHFPSDVVGPVALHDPAKWGKYWDDVRSLGVTEDRIELLKASLEAWPTPQQAIMWMAREVFEPAMVRKYGLDDEFDGLDLDFLAKIGLTPEIARNHWRAHWEHASFTQMLQMLHRGVLTSGKTVRDAPTSPEARQQRDAAGETTIYDWFRLVEIPPYWRDGLTSIMWDVPGRVEARMLAQYGLVDKKFLIELLARDGLAPEYRDIVADMMLVRGIRTDIQTRYAKGWLNAAGVKAEIDAAGLSEGIATKLYQWIVRNGAGDRTAGEKDVSKTEVIKAYKLAQITHSEAVEMLVDLGYDELEADFILAINAEVPSESPSEAQRVNIDTIRRSRRLRKIDHDQELVALTALGVDSALALAYTDNDDLRLVKAP